MNEKVLLIDDDPGILSGYKRQLRKHFDVETGLGGKAGLEIIKSKGPFAVVVSDMMMPEMDGIQFLSKVKDIIPSSVRIMLTGCSDQSTAIEAVNEGAIFRFINKPCDTEKLLQSLSDGVKQYRLITAERELLDKTLSGSIALLTDILSILDPDLYNQVVKLKDLVKNFAKKLNLANSWEIEAAAMFSQIGCIAVPPEILFKYRNGEGLSKEEQDLISRIPAVGANLLENIPRLQPVCRIVQYQNKLFDGGGFPQDSVKENKIPLGARILKVLWDLVQLESEGIPRPQAFSLIQTRKGWYDPVVLGKVYETLVEEEGKEIANLKLVSVSCSDLREGHILASKVETKDNKLLLSSGHKISLANLERLRNYSKMIGIKEPIYIEDLAPIKEEVQEKQVTRK